MTRLRTTVVGSYPTPEWLREPEGDTGRLQDALLVVLKTQEICGIDVLSDGELSRFDPEHPETNGMIESFIRPLSGVFGALEEEEVRDWRDQGRVGFRKHPAGVVRDAIGPGDLDLEGPYAAVCALTERPVKLTLTSPYMLAKTLFDRHYGDVRALTFALADVLAGAVAGVSAPVVQVDEAHITGHPEDGEWVSEALNRVLDAVSGERHVHLCFGNYGGRTVQKGLWEDLIPFLNALHADHLVLECARRDPDEVQVFRGIRSDLGIGVGVVDIKDPEVESAETIARRIEHAAGVLGPDRITQVHPDCGFWMLPRAVADEKMRALVQGRDLFIGTQPVDRP